MQQASMMDITTPTVKPPPVHFTPMGYVPMMQPPPTYPVPMPADEAFFNEEAMMEDVI
jgi:hypothetical protein